MNVYRWLWLFCIYPHMSIILYHVIHTFSFITSDGDFLDAVPLVGTVAQGKCM
jgi:hypothetical protein